jgi:mannose/fructose/N-acetylgalactosamine-specific phosphotransferase system component IIC
MGSLVAMYVLVGIICVAIIGAILALEKIRERDEERE